MKNENKKGATQKRPGAHASQPAAHAAAGKGGKEAGAEKQAAAGAGKGAGFPSIKLSERDRRAGVALLAIAAIALVAYVAFFMPPADKPSDMDTFVGRVLGASNVSLLMDARGASQESAKIVFQCGVDIVGGQLFGSKTITTYACDDSGCISANSASNGSNTLTYDTVQKKLREAPYIVVRSGAPSTQFFENHAEIDVDESFNASCKLG
ncbi:MAG: hypothetical protein WCY41_00675 [Candidatus Micrarchaeia archaeon]